MIRTAMILAAGRGERIVEGAAMHLLGLGERAVDIEDQGARPR